MNKKQAKRRRDIKTKLMAAICMLMVSSIMMVSTTYAWFTLSTAPEVTGINTAVGANGNLEIALMPKDGVAQGIDNDFGITSSVGDSTQAIAIKNVTWGNLVDLSDSSVYGLDSITLYPAALNGAYDPDTLKLTSLNDQSLLKTPSYGSDGRVAELVANTSTGYFDAQKNDFYPNTDLGVRAVGTASGMTSRQLVYRNARSAANTAAAQAKSVASASLNNNGSTLANIAIKKGTGSTTFTMADLESMQNIVNDLLGTDAKTGALEYIETAYMQYILAFSASGSVNDLDKDENAQAFKGVQGLVEAPDATLSSVTAGLSGFGVSLPSEITDVINTLASTKASVESAKTKLETLIATGADTYEWAEISEVLHLLANPETMTVNGIKAGEIMQGENMSTLVNSVASGGLKVTMSTGGGVYADIADHCGDFTAAITIEQIEYNGLVLKNMTARMETKSAKNPAFYLTVVGAAVEGAGAPASGNTASQPITDMFGYVVDMAFRTNAADSKLLLQQDAVDRIYGDNDNAGTMGHGSNMTFSVISNELNDAQVAQLISAIRIVFFNPMDGNKVIASAKLDAPTTNEAGEKVANLKLISMTATGETDVDSFELMPLTQNTAHALSVLVYLDGNLVGNDDVASAAATSLVGKLNLQFASTATLVPMDYSQLHTPKTSGDATTETTVPATTETTNP